MRLAAILILALGCLVTFSSRHLAIAASQAASSAVPQTAPPPTPNEAPLHLRDTFELTVHEPFMPAVALFGAHGERGWAGKDWDPKFLYPQPEEDKAGAVFTTSDNAPWVMTAFDPGKGHVQYVIFRGDLLITLLDIHLDAVDSANTKVKVVYEWTALKPEANEHIRHMAERHRGMGEHWEKAINGYLQEQGKSGK